jgi:hypothetical protein
MKFSRKDELQEIMDFVMGFVMQALILTFGGLIVLFFVKYLLLISTEGTLSMGNLSWPSPKEVIATGVMSMTVVLLLAPPDNKK